MYCTFRYYVTTDSRLLVFATCFHNKQAEKDMEWKYDRSKLYLDYIKEGNTLCVPFNLVPTWWGIAHSLKHIAGRYCRRGRQGRSSQKRNDTAFANNAFEVLCVISF